MEEVSRNLGFMEISCIKDVINMWPNRAALAKDINNCLPNASRHVSVARVHKWAQIGAIPAAYHHHVIVAASRRGFDLTAEIIVRLHAGEEA